VVRNVPLGVLLVGLILAMAACGRVPPTSNATASPSPTPNASPTAAPTPLTIPGPTLHRGEVGLAYAPVTIQATGGDNPFLWRISDGALPNGLSISQDGVISGTPAAAGTFAFTLEVMDASLAAANVAVSINVAPRLIVNYVGEMASHGSVSVCTGEAVGAYRFCWTETPDNRYAPFAAVSGGASPYTYSIVSGNPPPGTKLNGLALAGTFQAMTSGTYRFTVAVTDSLGATVTIVAVYDLWYHNNFPPPSP
jgi:hypothetical protein